MKATLACLGSLVAVALSASTTFAQYGYPAPPCYAGQSSYPVAPYSYGPYFYCNNGYPWYGPSNNGNPPFPPYSGILPCPPQCCQQQQQQPIYHPWARGPRDYFMWTEAQKELITRQTRPPFVP
jgi:hypothetical protein